MNIKKRVLLLVTVLLFVVSILGLTYAFFNYTRTGSANVLKVGRISFVSRGEETISLTNLFPIASSAVDNDIDNVGTFEIEIEGDTDYSGGIEYLVSIVDANIYSSSGKAIPISLDIDIDDLGEESVNYFTERENTYTSIYKKIVGSTIAGDGMMLVGYIKPNTVTGTIEGIDGSITIKAYIDQDNIVISDTYDGTESDYNGTTTEWVNNRVVFTTEEWNALQASGVSFKVKVEANEGIWVNPPLEEIMKKSAVIDNINSNYVSNSTPGINFAASSSDNNGKGVYIRSGTENDEYPIMYYRGDVDDNNVLFANNCWKMVRTTETGGVKLVYSGEPFDIYEEVPIYENEYHNVVNNSSNTFVYNDNSWQTVIGDDTSDTEISFTVPEGSNYKLLISGTSGFSGGTYADIIIYNGEDEVKSFNYAGYGADIGLNYIFDNLLDTDVIKVLIDNIGSSNTYPIDLNIQMVRQIGESTGISCDNYGVDRQISSSYNNVYPFTDYDVVDGYIVSSNSPGSAGYMHGGTYNKHDEASVSGAYFGESFTYSNGEYQLTNAKVGADNTHHYTCNQTSIDATCSSIRYYYFISGNYNIYINLDNGDDISKALEKMMENNNDSNAKRVVDEWYENNLSMYTNKIEDTIWCNDRSIVFFGGFKPTGSLTSALQFSPRRIMARQQPILVCTNKNDRFTVNNENGNKDLTYPVGLLTIDELNLSGIAYSNDFSNSYLTTGSYVWTMSPIVVHRFSTVGTFFGLGSLYFDPVYSSYGLQPAISIKPGSIVIDGDGSVTSPYVIK